MAWNIDKGKILTQIVMLVSGQIILLAGMKWLLKQMEPNRDQKDAAQAASKKVLQRLKYSGKALDEYEALVAQDVADPDELDVGFADVGGLEATIRMLQDEIVLPFSRPELFRAANSSRLLRPPKGLLLYGPPGCGKTLMAKALAKETGCCFINLKPGTFMDKWYGESQKIVAAVFSLARKLEPSLIFVDEIDAFLRERSSSDNEVSGMIKAQFMALWDGFDTDGDARVVVVGATNRPHDIDRAILRRLTRTCHVGLPGTAQRQSILSVTLRQEHLAKDVDLAQLSAETEGFSGSDLHELCRNAAMAAMRDTLRSAPAATTAVAGRGNVEEGKEGNDETSATTTTTTTASIIRPLCMADFRGARALLDGNRSDLKRPTPTTSVTENSISPAAAAAAAAAAMAAFNRSSNLGNGGAESGAEFEDASSAGYLSGLE